MNWNWLVWSGNDNLVEYYKNIGYRKLNNTDEKSNKETINNYRLTKAELEKQIIQFHLEI